jgi:hypothetical protein
MATTLEIFTMGNLSIAPRTVVDWNSVFEAGDWQDTITALHSPIPGIVFKGTVDILSTFVVVQTLRTKSGTVRTFQRASYEETGALVWETWEEKANSSTLDIEGKQDKANLVTSFGAPPSELKYPSEKLVKDSLDALTGANSSTTFSITNSSMVGAVPTIVAAALLPAGTYAAPKAYYGCAHDLYYAILQLVKTDGTVVCTFADKLGVMGWATATAGFELPAETQLNLVLSTNDAAEHAFILQFQF